ncbi:MAG: exosortase/archaeosortase family protein, partial [Candidatus Dormibacteraceae bacterium]
MHVSVLRSAPIFLPLAYLWLRLLNALRPEWSTNPQYSYGWVVPVLCIGLVIRRWHDARSSESEPDSLPVVSWSLVIFCAGLALLYLPSRLIEEATPEWRPVEWALAIITIGLTFCLIYWSRGGSWIRVSGFPIAFLFVAIPWPSLIEIPLIQGLTRASSATVVEVLDALGVPAMRHGNLLEVATGTVGIDEACSGIRSFQSSLMISLFLGEFYRLSVRRRVLLVPVGFALAFAFNVCRSSILTWIAAAKGPAAIASYHDEAGVAILVACTFTMWGVAATLKSRRFQVPTLTSQVPSPKFQVPSFKSTVSSPRSTVRGPQSTVRALSVGLLVWVVTVEVGVAGWYRIRESHIRPGPAWTVEFPKQNPTFR